MPSWAFRLPNDRDILGFRRARSWRKTSLRRSLPRLGPEARRQVETFLKPQALAVMAAIVVAWVASHFVGIGEIIDIILVVVGVFAIGLAVFDGVDHLFKLAEGAINAGSEADLDKAGQHFAEAVAILGIQAVMAVLFRNRPASYKGGPANVGPQPVQPGGLVARPGLTSTRAMPAGAGVTDPWGKSSFLASGRRPIAGWPPCTKASIAC
jgi:hypothetical protein